MQAKITHSNDELVDHLNELETYYENEFQKLIPEFISTKNRPLIFDDLHRNMGHRLHEEMRAINLCKADNISDWNLFVKEAFISSTLERYFTNSSRIYPIVYPEG